MRILPFFASGLRLAVKARFLWVMVFCLFSLFFAVVLAYQFGGRQPAVIALDVGLSVIRLLVPLVGVLLVQELILREFDRNYFLISVSYPTPRFGMLLGRSAAVIALILLLFYVMVVSLGMLVCFVWDGFSVDGGWVQRFLLMVLSYSLDFMIVASVAVFLAVSSSTPSFVLIGTLGFMVVARSYSGVVSLLAGDALLVRGQEFYERGLGWLTFLLPDLGGMDVRGGVLYGDMSFPPADWVLLMVSGSIYFFIVLSVSWMIFLRKRF